ncbi:MAG: hypothetical protein ACJASK_001781 [Ilumatobacter sp.]
MADYPKYRRMMHRVAVETDRRHEASLAARATATT